MRFLKSFELGQKLDFWPIILATDMLASQPRARGFWPDFIDADFDLVFNKTLSQKNGSMAGGPGPAKGSQNFQNMPSLWRHLQKSPHRKRKTFFSILTTRLAESVDGLDNSLAQSPGEL